MESCPFPTASIPSFKAQAVGKRYLNAEKLSPKFNVALFLTVLSIGLIKNSPSENSTEAPSAFKHSDVTLTSGRSVFAATIVGLSDSALDINALCDAAAFAGTKTLPRSLAGYILTSIKTSFRKTSKQHSRFSLTIK